MWWVFGKAAGISNESVMDIWNGDKLRKFRLMHLTGNKSQNAACATCDYVKVLPDSIDNDLSKYIKRFGV